MPDIRYNFKATGVSELATAFKTVTQAAKEAARQTSALDKATAHAGRAATNPQTGAKRGLTDLQKLAVKVAADQERAAKRAGAAQERIARQTARAQAKAAQDAAKAQERAAQQASRAQERESQKAARAQERAAKQAERAAVQLARVRERAAQRAARAERREAERTARRQAQEVAKERQRVRDSNVDFGKRIGRGIVGFGKAAAVGGVALAGLAVRDNMKLNETSTRLAISARDSGGKMLDPRALAKEFQDVATTTPGITANAAADAAARFAALTGDLDTARKSLKTFGTIATATGSDIGEIAEAAASLSNQMGIKSDDQFKEVFATLIAQGKGGAFELADMAAQFQRLAASGGAFGIEQSVAGVKSLGGLAQIARSGTGSSEQAATAMESLMTGLKTKSDDLKAAGVKVYNKDGSTRGLGDVLTDVVAKVGGTNMEKKSSELASLFGSYGGRALNPLITTFKGTYQSATGTKQERLAAATEAVRKRFEEAANAGGRWSDVVYEASVSQRLAGAQLSSSWERFSAQVGDKLTPVVSDLLGKFADLATNTSLVDSFIFTLEAFANAMQGTVDFLIGLGLVKKKVLTPEERAQKATQDLASFDAQHQGVISPALATERERLAKNVEEQNQSLVLTSDQALHNFTPEEFAQKYNELGGEGNNARGLNVANSIKNKEWGADNDFLFGLGNENEDQKRLRHQFQSQSAFPEIGAKTGQASGAVAAVDAQMKALGAAADNATKSLNKIALATQGSIVPMP